MFRSLVANIYWDPMGQETNPIDIRIMIRSFKWDDDSAYCVGISTVVTAALLWRRLL